MASEDGAGPLVWGREEASAVSRKVEALEVENAELRRRLGTDIGGGGLPLISPGGVGGGGGGGGGGGVNLQPVLDALRKHNTIMSSALERVADISRRFFTFDIEEEDLRNQVRHDIRYDTTRDTRPRHSKTKIKII